jgi:hypothetical protein
MGESACVAAMTRGQLGRGMPSSAPAATASAFRYLDEPALPLPGIEEVRARGGAGPLLPGACQPAVLRLTTWAGFNAWASGMLRGGPRRAAV